MGTENNTSPLNLCKEDNGVRIFENQHDGFFYFSIGEDVSMIKNPDGVIEGFKKIDIRPTFVECRTILGAICQYLHRKKKWSSIEGFYYSYEKGEKFIPIKPDTIYIYQDQLVEEIMLALGRKAIKPEDIKFEDIIFSPMEKDLILKKINLGYKVLFIHNKKEYLKNLSS